MNSKKLALRPTFQKHLEIHGLNEPSNEPSNEPLPGKDLLGKNLSIIINLKLELTLLQLSL